MSFTELNLLIKLQGTKEVMDAFAKKIGEGIGSAMQPLVIQSKQPRVNKVSVKKYSEMTGWSERKIRELCKKGKQEHEMNGRSYIILIN